jgi:hypothetical protein
MLAPALESTSREIGRTIRNFRPLKLESLKKAAVNSRPEIDSEQVYVADRSGSVIVPFRISSPRVQLAQPSAKLALEKHENSALAA